METDVFDENLEHFFMTEMFFDQNLEHFFMTDVYDQNLEHFFMTDVYAQNLEHFFMTENAFFSMSVPGVFTSPWWLKAMLQSIVPHCS